MTLAAGRPYVAIPGPTVVPDRVLAAMHRPSPNIYEGELHEMYPGILRDLRAVVGSTTAHVAVYIANGHGAWEAVSSNVFSRGDKALSAITGHFGQTWAVSLRGLGIEVDALDFGRGRSIDPDQIGRALEQDTAHTIRAVLMTHTDTATTVRNDIAAVRAAIDRARHPALLLVDGIASVACEEIRFDQWDVDVLIGASQKGLMMPPGLSFVWFSDKAKDVSEKADLVTPYWNWRTRCFSPEFYRAFAGTAPAQQLYGLREALALITEEGVDAVVARHQTLARAVWAAVDAWGTGGGEIGLNVTDPAARSHAVTSIRIGNGGAARLRRWAEDNAGLTLGIGLGMALPTEPAHHDHLRLAHMGYVNAHMTLGALAVMQAGLLALDIPHGSGAIEQAAAVIADATRR
ncbi:pyridoxal-phosphate-dependent aminotransferase family protein [Tianweitania populi]|uniref:Septum site-determining protein n=1 Tax=Tianweitania populi TaxID=1607949 RepID=A0A8J3DYG0_9HYPH|nr:aminotransferase class V-fold PLP-dependent enzyme [Tianweitania populi]GHD12547.1 septum site-determining protein [Tianweitania populi]